MAALKGYLSQPRLKADWKSVMTRAEPRRWSMRSP